MGRVRPAGAGAEAGKEGLAPEREPLLGLRASQS